MDESLKNSMVQYNIKKCSGHPCNNTTSNKALEKSRPECKSAINVEKSVYKMDSDSTPASSVFTGPILYEFSGVYFSSWTPVQQSCMINYNKRTNSMDPQKTA